MYNRTSHRMLDGKTPLNAHLMIRWEDKKISRKLFKEATEKVRTVSGELSKGQAVRHTFAKAIYIRNTYEIFKLKTGNKRHSPVTYELIE